MDIDERTASLRSPERSTTGSRAFMSLATQRKGTISSSKSPPQAAVAGAKSSVRAMSIWVEEMRFVGVRKSLTESSPRLRRKVTNDGRRAT